VTCPALHDPQDSSLSVWQRRGAGLTYSVLSWHKLLPPPLRVGNNAALATVSAAAAVWYPGTAASAAGDRTNGNGGGKGGSSDSGSLLLRRRFVSGEAAPDGQGTDAPAAAGFERQAAKSGNGGSEPLAASLAELLDLGGGAGGSRRDSGEDNADVADSAHRWGTPFNSQIEGSARVVISKMCTPTPPFASSHPQLEFC